MRPAPRVSRRSEAGFTILEVMVATLVMTVGVIGVFGMQIIAEAANRSTNNMRNASMLAESMLERMRRDSVMWVSGVGWPTNSMLGKAMTSPGSWTRPSGSASNDVMTYNQLGVPKVLDGENVPEGDENYATDNSNYCVYYRVTLLGDQSMARIEVRVAWPRNAEGEAIIAAGCNNVQTAANWGNESLGSVSASSIITPNPVVTGL